MTFNSRSSPTNVWIRFIGILTIAGGAALCAAKPPGGRQGRRVLGAAAVQQASGLGYFCANAVWASMPPPALGGSGGWRVVGRRGRSVAGDVGEGLRIWKEAALENAGVWQGG